MEFLGLKNKIFQKQHMYIKLNSDLKKNWVAIILFIINAASY